MLPDPGKNNADTRRNSKWKPKHIILCLMQSRTSTTSWYRSYKHFHTQRSAYKDANDAKEIFTNIYTEFRTHGAWLRDITSLHPNPLPLETFIYLFIHSRLWYGTHKKKRNEDELHVFNMMFVFIYWERAAAAICLFGNYIGLTVAAVPTSSTCMKWSNGE